MMVTVMMIVITITLLIVDSASSGNNYDKYDAHTTAMTTKIPIHHFMTKRVMLVVAFMMSKHNKNDTN